MRTASATAFDLSHSHVQLAIWLISSTGRPYFRMVIAGLRFGYGALTADMWT